MVSFTSIVATLLFTLTIATPFTGHSVQGKHMNQAVARSFEQTETLQRMIRSKRVGGSQMDKRALNLPLLSNLLQCPPGTTQSTNSVGLAVCLSNSLSAGNTPENCGGQRCQSSYNGVGVAVCLNAQCSVACPVGTRRQSTSSGMTFCA